MEQYFNISKKMEINPFEDVSYVRIAYQNSNTEKLAKFLNDTARQAEAVKIDGLWTLLFSIDLLDFPSAITWYQPYRGKIKALGTSMEFRIEDGIMHCW